MAHEANSVKSIYYALGANLAVFIAKLVAALMTGSGAMMAESLHSLADTGNQVLLLLGLSRAKRPPSEAYPLGPGKEIYFWSFIVALILFTAGGVFSIYEGFHKLSNPEALRNPWVAIAVLSFAIVAETISARACLIEVNKARRGHSLWQWLKVSRQSELIVIFGEDLAALFGLVLALIAILATMATGDPTYDALGSIGIGVLLVVIAFFIGAKVKDLLVGQGVEPEVRSQMLGLLEQRAEILRVFNFLSLQLGSDVMVAVKVQMRKASSGRELVKEINACEREFREHFPQVTWLFFEPDIED